MLLHIIFIFFIKLRMVFVFVLIVYKGLGLRKLTEFPEENFNLRF